MRERLLDRIHAQCCVGITPAYAGKTHQENHFRYQTRDHPRVCGKDPSTRRHVENIRGSPPRMRERLRIDSKDEVRGGITPAYAGKTKINAVARSYDEDHPRVCGKDSRRL